MAVLNGVKISIEDTSSLTADDAANIIREILALLRTRTLSVAYAASDPHLTITVT